MPPSDPPTERFLKHADCKLRIPDSISSLSPPLATSIGDVNYIINQSLSSSLPALFDLIQTGKAFCVCESTQQIENKSELCSLPSNSFQVLTAGSTQQPKKIVRLARSWISSFKTNAGLFGIDSEDKYAIVGQLTHSLPLYASLEAAQLGADIHCLADVSIKKQRIYLQKWNSTILYVTPTQLQLLVQSTQQDATMNETLRLILCGGGKLQTHTKKQAQRHFPNAVIKEFYGSAETSFISISDNNTPEGSVGKAYPDVNVSVQNPDRDNKGELCVSSPYLFSHYKEASGAHQDTAPNLSTDAAKGRTVNTGEIGSIDEQGYIYITGRKDRMVNIADQKVYPELLELLIQELPKVNECVVIPKHDRRKGYSLIAIVDTNDNERSSSFTAHIIEHCKQHFSALISPKSVQFVSPIPKLPSGKPDIQGLSDLINAKGKPHDRHDDNA